jgi:hypothetical protein
MCPVLSLMHMSHYAHNCAPLRHFGRSTFHIGGHPTLFENLVLVLCLYLLAKRSPKQDMHAHAVLSDVRHHTRTTCTNTSSLQVSPAKITAACHQNPTRCVFQCDTQLHADRLLQVRDGAYPTQKQGQDPTNHVHVYRNRLFLILGYVRRCWWLVMLRHVGTCAGM